VILVGLAKKILGHVLDAGGVELMHARTRWGHHAMHFAAGNFTNGCKVLKHLLEYTSSAAFQVFNFALGQLQTLYAVATQPSLLTNVIRVLRIA